MSRVEVTTLRGRGFLIDTTREVILGRERAVQSGRQDYILYEHPTEFADRVEVLSKADEAIEIKAGEEQSVQPEQHSATEVAEEENRPTETEPDQEEGRTPRNLGNVISTVFGRRT